MSLSPNFFKLKNNFLKKQKLLTDSSLTQIDDINTKEFFQYDSSEIDFSEVFDSKILTFMLFAAGSETIIKRFK